MTFSEFEKHIKTNSIVPVYKKFTADLISPALAYLNIRKKSKNSFLFESVEGIGKLARYSFFGRNPVKTISCSQNKITVAENGSKKAITQNLFDYLSNEVNNFAPAKIPELPYFTGGLVGYLGFETVALIEDTIKFTNPNELEIPDAIFGFYKDIVIFDHYNNQIFIVSNVFADNSQSPQTLYNAALDVITELKEDIFSGLNYNSNFESNSEIINTLSPDDYKKLVEKSKENIANGDVFQIVLSKRFETEFSGKIFNLYRSLRIINPTPYMHYIEFDNDIKIVGTSPEDLLKVKGNKATILPIAGTRKRGKSESEDLELEQDLLDDPKEIAEHTMLVDLARNDLGRVCEYNSVNVTEKFNIHKYSHVMHIVSRVEGVLRKEKNCIDALKASFPAGTVSGAPKIRAIQLINEYERLRRGIYAGAIGYIDFNGNLDLCIAIRTFFAKGNKLYWQAGAGIVADSKAENENQECNNKAAALINAIKFAEEIDENTRN